MDQNEAIKIVKKYKEILPDNLLVNKVYLYGSYAKNTFHKDSDIDVAIVVEKDEEDFFVTRPLLWKLSNQIDFRIEPILIDKNNDVSGFLEHIQSYGIEIN
jgi:predicted nucleotidyltransferase